MTILIALESIHAISGRTLGGNGMAAIKLDRSKAYDQVE